MYVKNKNTIFKFFIHNERSNKIFSKVFVYIKNFTKKYSIYLNINLFGTFRAIRSFFGI